jgi:hypothetical protein
VYICVYICAYVYVGVGVSVRGHTYMYQIRSPVEVLPCHRPPKHFDIGKAQWLVTIATVTIETRVSTASLSGFKYKHDLYYIEWFQE